jgi:peroxiredoxin
VVDKLGLEFPILADTERLALLAFDVVHAGAGPGGSDIARPATFIFDGGMLRWRDLTPNYRVRPRAGEVLAAVDEILTQRGTGSASP